MIAPQYRSGETTHQPDRWHPDPEAYRPPERQPSGASSVLTAVTETARRTGGKHPVLVVAAAASVGALLGWLVKRR